VVTYRTKAQLIIAVDDTDNPDQGGTGLVARTIAERLAPRSPVWGVSRHQFIILPEINYTRNNSGNAIHLLALPESVEELSAEVASWVRELVLVGSEPGLCLARPEALLDAELGREAQRRFVTREEARTAAAEAGAILLSPGEGDGGVVGAFAAACLASQGNDGRFVQAGRMRDLSGEMTVADVLAAGADEVRGEDDTPLTEGTLVAERLRPALRAGKCVLYYTLEPDGRWTPIIGAPGDRGKEEAARV
jgi:hypothetical protein